VTLVARPGPQAEYALDQVHELVAVGCGQVVKQ
jgi:hypothetical protein